MKLYIKFAIYLEQIICEFPKASMCLEDKSAQTDPSNAFLTFGESESESKLNDSDRDSGMQVQLIPSHNIFILSIQAKKLLFFIF
jgi:hypothetical protein